VPAGAAILIVEDQPFVGLAVADMVSALGACATEIVATIEDALAVLARGGFAAALLDIDLGGRSSEPVARALDSAHIPFVVTTGFDERVLAGFEDAPRLIKPYLPAELGRALASAIATSPSSRHPSTDSRP
jgi:CheY-like chemotaxis protein